MQDTPVSPQQWQFQPEDPNEEPQYTSEPAGGDGMGVSWTASEFLAHHKNGNWYLILIGGAVVLCGLIFLLTRDIISSSIVIIVAVLLAILAARQPRTLQYQLTESGLFVEGKFFPYTTFKSFSVINEGAINSIMLTPVKRFSPAVTMYYAPDDEPRILDVLSMVLPYEERQQDPIDRFMQRIRF